MHFKIKVTLILSLLLCLSLFSFGIFSYNDTKKNSIVQVESTLLMASNSLTDYIDLWLASKKNGVESSIHVSDIKVGDRIIIRSEELIPADSI